MHIPYSGHGLSNSIDNERVTIIHNSKWRFCTQNDERMRFNTSPRITHRIWTNVNHSRIRSRSVKTLHLAFVIMHIPYSEWRKEAFYHIGCPIRSIMKELQSFRTRNEDILLKTTKGGVLTLVFVLFIAFARISIIPVLERVSWKLYISRSYKYTYSNQNDERRRFKTSLDLCDR